MVPAPAAAPSVNHRRRHPSRAVLAPVPQAVLVPGSVSHIPERVCVSLVMAVGARTGLQPAPLSSGGGGCECRRPLSFYHDVLAVRGGWAVGLMTLPQLPGFSEGSCVCLCEDFCPGLGVQ